MYYLNANAIAVFYLAFIYWLQLDTKLVYNYFGVSLQAP